MVNNSRTAVGLGCSVLVVVSAVAVALPAVGTAAALRDRPGPAGAGVEATSLRSGPQSVGPVDAARVTRGGGALRADGDNATAIAITNTSGPRALAQTDDGSRVFAVLGGANAVLVLNTSTDTVTARIELADGGDPRDAVYTDGLLWVTDFANDAVHVVDPSARRIVETVAVGQSPTGIDETNGTVAVADWNGTDASFGAITLVDANSQTVSDTVQVPATDDGGPRDVSLCGPFAFVSNDGRDRLYTVNVTTGSVASIATGELARGVDCSAGGSFLVAAANAGTDIRMQERRLSTLEFTTSPSGTEQARWTRFLAGNLSRESVRTADGRIDRTRVGDAGVTLAYVHENGTVEWTRSVNLGIGARYDPTGIEVGSRGESVFVTDRNADMVFVLNSTTGAIERTFHAGSAPTDIVGANGKAYVANAGTEAEQAKGEPFDYGAVAGPGSITVHDSTTGRPVTALLAFEDERRAAPTGTVSIERTFAPRLLTSDPSGSTVFAPLSGSGDVLTVNTTTGAPTVIDLVGVTDTRSAASVGSELWVAPFGNGSIQILDTATKRVTDTVSACQNPWQIDEENGTVVVACWSGTTNSTGAVVFIDATSHDIVDIITPLSTNDGGPWGVSGCDDFVYVTNDGTDDTFRVDLATLEVELVASGELPWEVDCADDGGGHVVVPANGGADIPMRRTRVRSRVVGNDTVWWNLTQEGPTASENVTFDGYPWLVQESFGLSDVDTIAFALDTRLNVSNGNGVIDQAEFDRAVDLWEAGEPVPGTRGLTLTSSRVSKLERMKTDDAVVDRTQRNRWGHANAVFLPVAADGTVKTDEKAHISVGVGDRFEPWGLDFSPDGETAYIVDMHADVVYVTNTSTGSLTRVLGTSPAPRDSIAVGGDLYVANSGTHQISSKDGVADRFNYTSRVLGPGSIGVIDLDTGTAETSISVVERRSVGLRLAANATEVERGDVVEFTVTRADTGLPVNATVRVDGTELVTGGDGTVSYRVTGEDSFTAEAAFLPGKRAPTPVVTFRNDSLTLPIRDSSVGPTASVTFADQTVANGSGTVTVASANASVDYYVDVDGPGIASAHTRVFNASEERTDVAVSLNESLVANTTLTATVRAAANDSELATDDAAITVSAGFSPSDYDTDGDGSVSGDFNGVIDAIADYNAGELTFQQVVRVIAAYNG